MTVISQASHVENFSTSTGYVRDLTFMNLKYSSPLDVEAVNQLSVFISPACFPEFLSRCGSKSALLRLFKHLSKSTLRPKTSVATLRQVVIQGI